MDALELLVRKIGVNRIMLGTDYPFPLGELSPGKLVRSASFLSDADKERILGMNVMEFLGLRAEDFM